MSIQICELGEKHLEDAAKLVSACYRSLRRQVPLLPLRYEQPDLLQPMLDELMQNAPGVAALRGGRLVGILSGLVLPDFLGQRAAYSPEWAHAAEPDASRRLYEAMYARLSADWIADGCWTHLITILSNDQQALEGWHWLGFGLANVDGVRDLSPVQADAPEVEIRQATARDLDTVRAFDRALDRHLSAAPTFWPHDSEGFESWFSEPTTALWLAIEGGEPIGCMGIGRANPEACQIIQEEGTASIMMAYTRTRARDRGVAAALLNRGLAWAKALGYTRCAVDFESANILAARFWMRWFEPVSYSLIRCIPRAVQPHRPS